MNYETSNAQIPIVDSFLIVCKLQCGKVFEHNSKTSGLKEL